MDSDSSETLARTTRQTALGLCLISLLPLIGLTLSRADSGGEAPRLAARAARDSSQSLRADGIDPNTAAWYEIAQLPGIGETIARRIVAYRSAHQADGDGVIFRSAADLDNVQGIGRRTVDRIAPFLVFPTRQSTPVD